MAGKDPRAQLHKRNKSIDAHSTGERETARLDALDLERQSSLRRLMKFMSTPAEAFEISVGRLGTVAESLSSVALSRAIAVARIEAEGDRLDRLNAENQERLDNLLKGKW